MAVLNVVFYGFELVVCVCWCGYCCGLGLAGWVYLVLFVILSGSCVILAGVFVIGFGCRVDGGFWFDDCGVVVAWLGEFRNAGFVCFLG